MRLELLGIVAIAAAGAATADQVRAAPAQPPINVSPPPVMHPPPPSPPPAPLPPVEDAKTPARPYSNPAAWVTSNDYPSRALREEREGLTGFRLTIGPDGRPFACDITGSSGSPDLDATVCTLMLRRGRFYPALDAEGTPVVGTWSSRMRWVIPKVEDILIDKHPVTGVSVIVFTVGKTGYATDCRVISGTDPALFLNFVSPCEGSQKFPIYTDARGNPVERRVRITVGVTLPGTQPAAPRKKKR